MLLEFELSTVLGIQYKLFYKYLDIQLAEWKSIGMPLMTQNLYTRMSMPEGHH